MKLDKIPKPKFNILQQINFKGKKYVITEISLLSFNDEPFYNYRIDPILKGKKLYTTTWSDFRKKTEDELREIEEKQ